MHWKAWGQYVAVAAAYDAVYEITRYVSPPQFLLMTGLRLACMLLLPMRFWPALAIGEFVPLAQNAIFCADKFGVPWAVVMSIPSIALYWPVIGHLLKRRPLYDAYGCLRMPMIVCATLAASVITAGLVTASWLAALMHDPGKFPAHDPTMVFVSRLAGSYLGALTLTPVILAISERYRERRETLMMGTIWRSPLLRDILWWAAPALAVTAWIAMTTAGDSVRQLGRLALLWPVLGLAWRHGWHGTAVGGLMASYALAFTAKGLLDPDTLKAQVAMSVVLTGALIAGARSHIASRRLHTNRQ